MHCLSTRHTSCIIQCSSFGSIICTCSIIRLPSTPCVASGNCAGISSLVVGEHNLHFVGVCPMGLQSYQFHGSSAEDSFHYTFMTSRMSFLRKQTAPSCSLLSISYWAYALIQVGCCYLIVPRVSMTSCTKICSCATATIFCHCCC